MRTSHMLLISVYVVVVVGRTVVVVGDTVVGVVVDAPHTDAGKPYQ